MNIFEYHSFYQKQKTGALLQLLHGHCRSSEHRKSFLALCYELRKRGFEI